MNLNSRPQMKVASLFACSLVGLCVTTMTSPLGAGFNAPAYATTTFFICEWDLDLLFESADSTVDTSGTQITWEDPAKIREKELGYDVYALEGYVLGFQRESKGGSTLGRLGPFSSLIIPACVSGKSSGGKCDEGTTIIDGRYELMDATDRGAHPVLLSELPIASAEMTIEGELLSIVYADESRTSHTIEYMIGELDTAWD